MRFSNSLTMAMATTLAGASAEAPGYRIGYYMGMSEILKMRDEYKRRTGDRFTLSDFHERLLKVGNMPPALMREALWQGLDQSH